MNELSRKMQLIIDLGLTISRIKDLDLLLEKILQEARHFTRADAGSIYLCEEGLLFFSYTQNDTLQKLLPPGKKLIYSTFSLPINRDSLTGYVASTGETINITDAYELAGGTPFTFDRSYDQRTGYRTRSIITFPLKTVRGEITGVLQLINARGDKGEILPFPVKDEPFLIHFANLAAAAIERAKLTRGIIMRMNKMAELRDPKETGPHVKRVSAYSVAIYEQWAHKQGVENAEIEQQKDSLRMAAMLHDVGKVAISDLILKKPGRFNDEEFEIMKQHTVLGARLFTEHYSDMDEVACIVALNHHERWDGGGYPGHINLHDGSPLPGRDTGNGIAAAKKGEEIPLFGRIVAIADVYDALSSQRCYKEAWSEDLVLESLRSEAGKQFDPQLIDIFFEIIDTIHHITSLYPHE